MYVCIYIYIYIYTLPAILCKRRLQRNKDNKLLVRRCSGPTAR